MGDVVTVVIPVFNGDRFLKDAIDSVLAQTYPAIECIVVNDGSTDGTGKILDAMKDRVSVVHQTRSGVAAARNRGVLESESRFLAFLDSDDVWLPRKIETQVAVASRDESLGLIYTSLHLVNEALRFIGRVRCAPADVALRNTLLLEKPFMTGIGSTGLVPRASFNAIGGFDEHLSTSADLDLACRIAIRYRVLGIDRPLVMYRTHPGQMHADPEGTEREVGAVFDKLFDSEELPRPLKRLRGRAQANLDISLAGRYLLNGEKRNFIRYAGRAALRRPDRAFNAIRRLSLPDAGITRAQ